MAFLRHMKLHLVLIALFLASGAAPVQAKSPAPPPVAVEARFKERITAKLKDARNAAAEHLAQTLGVPGSGKSFPDAFHLYELDFVKGEWTKNCNINVTKGTDSVAYCAIRKLQAMTALCDVEDAVERYRDGISELVALLTGKRDKVVPGLHVKRSLLPIGNGLEAWMHETFPGSKEFDVLPALHAAAMLASVRCGSALGMKDIFRDVGSWFTAMQQMYPKSSWEKQSFHTNAILLETLVLIAADIRKDSSLAEEIGDFTLEFESWLQAEFTKNEKVWSFSGAQAVISAWSSEKKVSRKKRLAKTVDEYIRRWASLAPMLNVSTSYSCGPLQGIAPLAMKRGNSADVLVSQVLKLAEKDVDLFQVRVVNDTKSIAADSLGSDVLDAHKEILEGGFLRDSGQLQQERRISIRVDDTAQCVLALTRTLKLLDDLLGVEVPTPSEAEGKEGKGSAAEKNSDHGSEL